MYSEMTSVDPTIITELECPVCTEYMHPPIRQCILGHNFCDDCFEKLEHCPTCRKPKSKARSYILERLHHRLPFPCKNNLYGCKTVMMGALIQKHEELCQFGPIDCPLKVINNCEWHGQLLDVIKHCKAKHPTNVYVSSKQKLTCANFLRYEHARCYYYIMFKAFEEVFKVALHINFETGIMKWCVYHMGSRSPDVASKYSYEIEIENRMVVFQKLCLRAPCQPMLPSDETFSYDNCVITHCDMIKKFCVDEDFIYTVKLFNKP